ncbi:hypothetical protein F4825DRAFT_470517 [Nemania diffusa]|nr:hypothetical protein F4825DRAFT_470517 [Nemania diffusa]
MPSVKKSHHKPTRHQPRRAIRLTEKMAEAEGGNTSTNSNPSMSGVHKQEVKSRCLAQRKRKKLQNALIKRVDARNPQDAFTEQSQLLNLSYLLSPTSPKCIGPPKSPGQDRRNRKGDKKYMDENFGVDDSAEGALQRSDRWIPNFEYRSRPTHKPRGVPHSLWMSYTHLDDYIYRQSLSPAEVEALPLLEDVYEYQNSNGRTPRPITPPGFTYDENLELVPVEA